MKVLSFFSALLLTLPVSASPQTGSSSTTSPQRDPQAVALLQTSVRSMGGTVPSDSVATGSIIIVAGSQTSTGTIRILTRGNSQTSQQITLPESTTTVTYSAGIASETLNSATTSLSLERAATSQSVCFPLPFLVGALASSDMSIQYVGLESLNQTSVQHIRFQNSFASQPNLQQLADFAIFDIWLDANTALPQRISFIRRDALGASPRIPMDTYFTSYQAISGVAYPSQIKVSFNGTPWATITISSVSFNTGLTDSSFSVQ
jgi:hypothetical protein